MLVISLIIFHAISASICYDLEMEGVLKVGKDLLKVLNRNANVAEKLNLPQQFASKGKLPSWSHNNLQSVAERSSVNLLNNEYTTHLEEFTLHLKQQGEKTLQKMGKQILHDLNLSNKNTTSLVKAATNDFENLLHNYYIFVSEDTNVALVENDYLYLDIVETYCRLLYNEEKKLLNDIIIDNKVKSKNKTILAINNKISKHIIVEKKRKLNHICEKYQVCREYSTFTDRCGDLISQLLKLPEDKLFQFIKMMSAMVKKHDDVLENTVEKEDRTLILSKLETISRNIYRMKEFLAVLRAVISQKIKSTSASDKNERYRTIATRILFDIIDKALNTDENLLDIDFDNTISAINRWSNNMAEDVEALPAFVDNTLRTFKYKITKNARREIKVLVTTILGGKTEDVMTFEYLFAYGSKYVKGNDFHFDVDD